MIEIICIVFGVLAICLVIVKEFYARSRLWLGIALGLVPVALMEIVLHGYQYYDIRDCLNTRLRIFGVASRLRDRGIWLYGVEWAGDVPVLGSRFCCCGFICDRGDHHRVDQFPAECRNDEAGGG